MHRQELLATISRYRQSWLNPETSYEGIDVRAEDAVLRRFQTFVESTPDCFERTSPAGHVTGSALVVSRDLNRVLLTLHRKLNLWLQLGGHSDGSPRPSEVAWREAEEESGLANLEFLDLTSLLGPAATPAAGQPPLPFDFDHHDIPARPKEAGHVHYDVRYLLVADDRQALVITEESKDLRWFTLAEARAVTAEPSMLRQFDKLAWIRANLG